MTARFTVLASGSSGNAALLEVDGFGLLIDCGLPPRTFTARLKSAGLQWERISAAIVTHTHSDHWKDAILHELVERDIPVYAHADHLSHFERAAESYSDLIAAGLTREYTNGARIYLTTRLSCLPIRVSHDSEPTFAFRIDGLDSDSSLPTEPDHVPRNPAWSIGYASDLGCWEPELAAAFAGVDVLAVEYNHDEMMERNSPRPWYLVNRVLGDTGHLSNRQAAELTAAVAGQSGEGFPAHLIQLHLSRECNTPELAAVAGREALVALNPATEVITARQDAASKSISLTRRPNSLKRSAARVHKPHKRKSRQQTLPGFGNHDW